MSLFMIKTSFFFIFFPFQLVCPLIHVADHSDMIKQVTMLRYSSLKIVLFLC